MHRANVLLPHPDSPTRPKVSPLATLKLTPSTALTEPVARRNRPVRVGKCFSSPWMTTRASCDMEPAPHVVAGSEIGERRLLAPAALVRMGTAILEGTADRQVAQARHHARNG